MRKVIVVLSILLAGVLFAQTNVPNIEKVKDGFIVCVFERDSLRDQALHDRFLVADFLADLKKLNQTPQLDSLLLSRNIIKAKRINPVQKIDKKAK